MTSEITKKQTPWLQGENLTPNLAQKLPAGLYLVATPIGSLRDITLRALDVLAAVDEIFCEDTRVSKKLLNAYGIQKKLGVYNDHSDNVVREKIIKSIAAGKSIALISDAGMPLVSDPGYKLVRDCLEREIYVTSVPGANAPLAALQLSGLPSDQFCFLGFLPHKEKARREVLETWKDVPGTLVAFESARRLLKTLEDMAAVLQGRDVAIVREITKLHEEVRRGSIEELLAHYNEYGEPRGEIVIVVAPPGATAFSNQDIQQKLRTALDAMGTKEAAATVAKETGVSRRELYALALTINKGK